MISFGPWEPDKGRYATDSIDTMMSALPLSNGWGPLPQPVAVSNSLGSQCYGAWYVRLADGSYKLLAGTKTGLFIFNTTTKNWDNISGSSPYSVPDGDMWQGIQYGSLFIVTALGAPPQKYNVETGGSFSDLGGSPPQAKYIAIASDFVVLGYLRVSGQEFPLDIHWSGLNDAETWTLGRKSSDRQTLPDGDEIMGLFSFVGGARIIQRKTKRAMVFTGTDYVFQIKVLDPNKGAVAPLAIVPISSEDYVVLREDGFFRGDNNLAIGAERVDRTFLASIDLNELATVQGIADPFNKVVIWRYKSEGGAYKLIGYQWQLDRWFRADVAATVLISSVTPGMSLEDLDAYGTVDTLPASLDSRIWKGGRPTVGAFLSDNKLSLFSGTPLACTLETPDLELNPGSRSFVGGVYGVGDIATFTIKAAAVERHGKLMTFGAASSPHSRTGLAPMRLDGRLHRFQVSIAAGADWTHFHGLRPLSNPSGEA